MTFLVYFYSILKVAWDVLEKKACSHSCARIGLCRQGIVLLKSSCYCSTVCVGSLSSSIMPCSTLLKQYTHFQWHSIGSWSHSLVHYILGYKYKIPWLTCLAPSNAELILMAGNSTTHPERRTLQGHSDNQDSESKTSGFLACSCFLDCLGFVTSIVFDISGLDGCNLHRRNNKTNFLSFEFLYCFLCYPIKIIGPFPQDWRKQGKFCHLSDVLLQLQVSWHAGNRSKCWLSSVRAGIPAS